MNSGSIVTKVEFVLYSTLISVMSGIRRIKTGEEDSIKSVVKLTPEFEDEFTNIEIPAQPRSIALRWQSVQQQILSLLIWILLGFAAGFLIGMLRSG